MSRREREQLDEVHRASMGPRVGPHGFRVDENFKAAKQPDLESLHDTLTLALQVCARPQLLTA